MISPIAIPGDIEDVGARFPVAGFYLSARELVWVMLAGFAELALVLIAAAGQFAVASLVALAGPPLLCWIALQLRIEGAAPERWAFDVVLFALLGRIAHRGRPPAISRQRFTFPNHLYLISCPGRALAAGRRDRKGFRFASPL